MRNSEDMNIESDFDGKTVSFSTASDTLAVKNIRFVLQRERLFVVGEVPMGATNNDWAAGRQCAISWNSITDYIVFDSESQYIDLMAKSQLTDSTE